MDTVTQIIDMEMKVIRRTVDQLAAAATRANGSSSGIVIVSGSENNTQMMVPRGFMCPITLELMHRPVVAADGHSYEETAIVRWLQNNNTSPVTNLRLKNKDIAPNHSLAAAIQDFKQQQQTTVASAAPAAAAAAAVTTTTPARRSTRNVAFKSPSAADASANCNKRSAAVLADTASSVGTASANKTSPTKKSKSSTTK
jgi:hypothetical protein